MQIQGVATDWLDRLVAAVFAIILVLGTAAVVLTLVVYFPGAGSDVPLP